jgi:hypothetical protein
MIKRQINNIKRVFRIIGVHHYSEQIKSYSFYFPRKCMPKDEVFSIILFTLYLVTNKLNVSLTQNPILMAIHVNLTH